MSAASAPASTHRPPPVTIGSVGHRPCVRPGCGRRATTTLRFDYAERTVMLDPVGPDTGPGEYDLCLQHAARSGPPSGWTLRDRAPSRTSVAEPAPPVGPDRGQGVARLAAALSAVPRAVSEDAPDAAPDGTDRPVAVTAVTGVPAPRAATSDAPTSGPRGSSRLDPLLRSSTAGSGGPAATVRPVPLSERTPEVEVRVVPQPLRLAPDPTTTVWCADLLGPRSDRDAVGRRGHADLDGLDDRRDEPTLFA